MQPDARPEICRYDTPWGAGFAACRHGGVTRVWLPGSEPPEVRESVCPGSGGLCGQVSRQLGQYFYGERRGFDLPLDLSGLSAFAAAVLRIAMRIPPGEVRTYGWLADGIGRPGAARACGQVMARNPLPVLVPCHRVVAAGGGAGGYSAGLIWKKRLLALEGFDLSLPPGVCAGGGYLE